MFSFLISDIVLLGLICWHYTRYERVFFECVHLVYWLSKSVPLGVEFSGHVYLFFYFASLRLEMYYRCRVV